MKTNKEINKTLRDAVNQILGNPTKYQVIRADQSAPRPDDPYCTVKILSSVSVSEEETSHRDIGNDQIEVTYKAMRKVMASFNFYRSDDTEFGDPVQLAGKVKIGLNRQSTLDLLGNDSIGLLNRGEVKNLTQSISQGFEDRAGFTCYFSVVDTDTEIIDIIVDAETQGTFEYAGRAESIDIELI